jgi:hypothetical protein
MGRFRGGLLFSLLLFGLAVRADTMPFAGALTTNGMPDPNAVFASTFTLTTASDVLIETFSYGGLTDPQGNVLNAGGGFLPDIVISNSGIGSKLLADSSVNVGLTTGVSACLPANTDPSGFCGDAAVEILNLAIGTYTFDITVAGNHALVDLTGNLTGFDGGGSFFFQQGLLDSHLAGDVIVTPETSTVPEPASWWMLGSGLCGLLFRNSRKRSS